MNAKYDYIVIQVDAMTDSEVLQRRLDDAGEKGYQVVAAAPAGVTSHLVLQRMIDWSTDMGPG